MLVCNSLWDICARFTDKALYFSPVYAYVYESDMLMDNYRYIWNFKS